MPAPTPPPVPPNADPWLGDGGPALPGVPLTVYRYAPGDPPAGPGDGSPGDTPTIPPEYLPPELMGGSGAGKPPPRPPSFYLLDNLEVVQVEDGLGADPGHAQLRYRFGTDDPLAPANFAEALSVAVTRPKTVRPDDRLVIIAGRPDGALVAVADVIALGFDPHVDRTTHEVGLTCPGITFRCDDTPVRGAIWRSAADDGSPLDVQTDLDATFNARGKPNRCPGPFDPATGLSDKSTWGPPSAVDDRKFPTFYDDDRPPDPARPAETTPQSWDQVDLARYLLWGCNAAQTWAKNPPGYALDDVLVSRVPVAGASYDPNDPTSYTRERILVADQPATGKGWRHVLEHALADKGYGFRCVVGGVAAPGRDGTPPASPPEPTSTFQVFNVLDGPPGADLKSVWLTPGPLDSRRTNVASADLSRDVSEVVNRWIVRGREQEWQADFVLACGFACDPADVGRDFSKNAAGFDAIRNKYRLFVFDEAGEGHYYPGSNTKLTTPTSLDAVFGAPLESLNADGTTTSIPRYAKRRRSPVGEMLSVDSTGRALEWTLWISTDYGGPAPAVWDASAPKAGTWYRASGGSLLKDTIGVRIDCEDPNDWAFSKPISPAANFAFGGGKCRIVDSLARPPATPAAGAPEGPARFFLRLSCVVRADERLRGVSPEPRDALITRPVERYIDADDRLFYRTILRNSEHNRTAEDVAVRDDTTAAEAEASALLLATQDGRLGGEIVLPYFTRDIAPGDRIGKIQGIDVGLQTSADPPEGQDPGLSQTPVYPVVLHRKHSSTAAGQSTTLAVSDANFARKGYRARAAETRVRKR